MLTEFRLMPAVAPEAGTRGSHRRHSRGAQANRTPNPWTTQQALLVFHGGRDLT